MKRLASLCMVLTPLMIFSCATGNKRNSDSSTSAQIAGPNVLTRDGALARYRQIAHVSYTLWLGLDETSPDYHGRVVINFDLRPRSPKTPTKKDIDIDFEGGSIFSISLNGSAQKNMSDTERYDGHTIRLKTSELQQGMNRIEIAFSHPFSTDGTGFTYSKNKQDGELYIYSKLEPYAAHRMFPCFDQPDLKASYEVTVEAPENWEVISNMKERDVSKVDGRKSWAFPPSPLFSTYVFAIHAGTFDSWKENANGIPLRLFAPKSISSYINPDDWFSVTEKGLEFFNTEVGYPYPYSKYDQILVPGYFGGAMESIGAITFNADRYVFRTRVTKMTLMKRSSVILHEMAHMWFGNLVTPHWWNGTWLNESFATFMSTLAEEKALHNPTAWQAFFDWKKGAYREDQLVTTHPVEVPVANTDQSISAFDSITYGKGASLLKQLRYYMGEEDFREGLQRYIQKFALRNTTINDFFKMLVEASSKGKDLLKWQKLWLHTSGVNILNTDWACEKDAVSGKSLISKLNLIQSGNESTNPLRPHKTKVALFYLRGGRYIPQKIFETEYSEAETPVSGAIGKPCPDFIFPNHDDMDYVKVELDPVTLGIIAKNISKVEHSLDRQMLWHSLWERVLDGKLKPQDYADIALNQAGGEKDTEALWTSIENLASPSLERASVLKFLPDQLRLSYQTKIEDFLKKHLLSARGGTDVQLFWYRAFLSAASTQDSTDYVLKLLKGKAHLVGLKIDQERRWDLIKVLARNNLSEPANLIDQEAKKDPTPMGRLSAVSAQALIPDLNSKKKWLNEILNLPEPMPLTELREAMFSFPVLGQETFVKDLIDPYFNKILTAFTNSGKGGGVKADEELYLRNFTSEMYPSLCDSQLVERTNQLLNQHPELPAQIAKILKAKKQEEERCIQVRANAAS